MVRAPFLLSALLMVSAPPVASGARPRTSTPKARRVRGRQREAARAQTAEPVSEAYDLPRGFRMVRSEGRIHARSRFHIGAGAYCVWALPPISEELSKGTDKK